VGVLQCEEIGGWRGEDVQHREVAVCACQCGRECEA
jgi:hypothetical protein